MKALYQNSFIFFLAYKLFIELVKEGYYLNDINHEVLIIGGGIIGASISYFLSKAGYDVGLIESKEIASLTSSHCDGNILAIDKTPGFDSQMTLRSQKLIHELSKELILPFEYRKPGSILVCETEKEMQAAEQWVQQQRDYGLDFKMLDKQDIKNESKYFSDHLLGVLECSTDSTVNPYMLTYSFIETAKQHGLKVYEYEHVKNINKSNETFYIQTTNHSFYANKVVNACGIYASEIGSMLDVHIPIYPRKGQILVASRNETVGIRKVMEFGYLMSKFGGERQVSKEMEDYGIALVFEPTESQNFLIGSSREFNGYDKKVNSKVNRLIAQRAIHFYPKLKDMSLIRTYSGLRPFTEDHLPIVSETEVEGFYVAAGHEGDGIGLSSITGLFIEQLISDKETEIDISPLSVNRFKEV